MSKPKGLVARAAPVSYFNVLMQPFLSAKISKGPYCGSVANALLPAVANAEVSIPQYSRCRGLASTCPAEEFTSCNACECSGLIQFSLRRRCLALRCQPDGTVVRQSNTTSPYGGLVLRLNRSCTKVAMPHALPLWNVGLCPCRPLMIF